MKKNYSTIKPVILLFILAIINWNCTSDEQEDISSDKDQVLFVTETTNNDPILNILCGEAIVTQIFAGQNIDIGDLIVGNDQDSLYVSFNLENDWYLQETHLYVGDCDKIPLGKKGNPKLGHFPYSENHEPIVQNYVYTIALSDIEDDCFCVSAHAKVIKLNKDEGSEEQTETAFAFGENEFPGNRWGWYFEYCKQLCR